MHFNYKTSDVHTMLLDFHTMSNAISHVKSQEQYAIYANGAECSLPVHPYSHKPSPQLFSLSSGLQSVCLPPPLPALVYHFHKASGGRGGPPAAEVGGGSMWAAGNSADSPILCTTQQDNARSDF